mmetsp:Transcript_18514/g.58984  ORF Transcript_18514/g.58984 Transcript_18514/m.58984 type:complete len:93 (-) Transcript_18514:417-695(-)
MIAGSGFALSAGLETAAAAANAAGFTGVGMAAQRAGSALRVASQVAAVGAAVATIPEVRKALEDTGEKARDRPRCMAERWPRGGREVAERQR